MRSHIWLEFARPRDWPGRIAMLFLSVLPAVLLVLPAGMDGIRLVSMVFSEAYASEEDTKAGLDEVF